MERVIIVHPDGRSFSVTRDAYEQLYASQGFTINGAETGAAFMGALGRAVRPQRPRRRVRGRFVREDEG